MEANRFISTTSPRPSPPLRGGEGDDSRGVCQALVNR